MNKIKKLLKGSPVAMVVGGLLVAGAVSAALLTVYVSGTGTGTVEQSVVFANGELEKSYSFNTYSGNTFEQCYNLKNRSEVEAPIKFVTTQCVDGEGGCGTQGNEVTGLETTYWSSVELENKDLSDWSVIDSDERQGTLKYQLNSDKFNYELEVTDLNSESAYVVIYYADQQERFTNWGGDNPGAEIASFTTDSEGNASLTGSTNLKMDLPHSDDWNRTADPDYCDNHNGNDDYDLCEGAKVWIVPSGDWNGTKVTPWNPGEYLFETDLIVYDDVDTNGEALFLGKGKLDFCVRTTSDVSLVSDNYKIITEVTPAE